jgi:aminopeptidase-like protein
VAELYPICRSITGNGFRETLQILRKYVPLDQHEIPSGTRVFDWTIPNEWNIRDAYIKNSSGERVIDFGRSNLHVLNYSSPVHKILPLRDLRPHLHTLPNKPDLIPYRTSYYEENWGFCLTQRQLDALPEGDYEVCINSSLEPGHLTYGELYLEGASSDEVLFSCHACHPSLCNDNLSGIAVATFLALQLARKARRVFSYRFLFIPGTIGSITWLAHNEKKASQIRHGLTLACVGDSGPMTYKRSRRGDTEIDRAVIKVLRDNGEPFSELNFSPYGYDERQFCSPGFNLPVGCLSRTPHGKFDEYHTSADNLDFVKAGALAHSLSVTAAVCEVLEGNARYVNRNPKCEPQLGKRGLYATIGGHNDAAQMDLAILWVLNFSDGEHDLLDIAERSTLPFKVIKKAADLLVEHALLTEISSESGLNFAEREFLRSASSHR